MADTLESLLREIRNECRIAHEKSVADLDDLLARIDSLLAAGLGEPVGEVYTRADGLRALLPYRSEYPPEGTKLYATPTAAHDAVVEACAKEARECWENGIPAQEFEERIRALRRGRREKA